MAAAARQFEGEHDFNFIRGVRIEEETRANDDRDLSVGNGARCWRKCGTPKKMVFTFVEIFLEICEKIAGHCRVGRGNSIGRYAKLSKCGSLEMGPRCAQVWACEVEYTALPTSGVAMRESGHVVIGQTLACQRVVVKSHRTRKSAVLQNHGKHRWIRF